MYMYMYGGWGAVKRQPVMGQVRTTRTRDGSYGAHCHWLHGLVAPSGRDDDDGLSFVLQPIRPLSAVSLFCILVIIRAIPDLKSDLLQRVYCIRTARPTCICETQSESVFGSYRADAHIYPHTSH